MSHLRIASFSGELQYVWHSLSTPAIKVLSCSVCIGSRQYGDLRGGTALWEMWNRIGLWSEIPGSRGYIAGAVRFLFATYSLSSLAVNCPALDLNGGGHLSWHRSP